MIDTNSPDYKAGLAAGRRSFRLSVFSGFVGPNHCVVKDQELPALALLSSFGPIEFGRYRLVVLDTMPGFGDYPDEDSLYND